MTLKFKTQAQKRRARVRRKLSSTRPRLSVFRSGKKIYAQIIDDQKKKTLVSASEKDLPIKSAKLAKTQKAKQVGEKLAKKALKAKIKAVVFDRGQYKYHGRIKALASGARSQGLKF